MGIKTEKTAPDLGTPTERFETIGANRSDRSNGELIADAAQGLGRGASELLARFIDFKSPGIPMAGGRTSNSSGDNLKNVNGGWQLELNPPHGVTYNLAPLASYTEIAKQNYITIIPKDMNEQGAVCGVLHLEHKETGKQRNVGFIFDPHADKQFNVIQYRDDKNPIEGIMRFNDKNNTVSAQTGADTITFRP